LELHRYGKKSDFDLVPRHLVIAFQALAKFDALQQNNNSIACSRNIGKVEIEYMP
jgi:hypothetical protein